MLSCQLGAHILGPEFPGRVLFKCIGVLIAQISDRDVLNFLTFSGCWVEVYRSTSLKKSKVYTLQSWSLLPHILKEKQSVHVYQSTRNLPDSQDMSGEFWKCPAKEFDPAGQMSSEKFDICQTFHSETSGENSKCRQTKCPSRLIWISRTLMFVL